MENRLHAIDYDKILKRIEEILESYGISLNDLLSHTGRNRFSEYERSDCCSQVDTEMCCPEGEQLLDDFDEFDWQT
ncbi:MAG: hypothetical protein ACFFF9_14705 [Candidatus Thorarchaeota archaeon]